MRTEPAWHSYDLMAQFGEYGSVVSTEGTVEDQDAALGAHFIQAAAGRNVVADLGCGTGFPGLLVAPHVKRLIAVDASPAMLACAESAARQMGLANWHALRASAEHIPLPDGSVDAVIMSGFLGSIECPERVLPEIRRVLGPDSVVATLDQDFGARMGSGIPDVSYAVGFYGADLIVRRCSLCTDPDRIETRIRRIGPSSACYADLLGSAMVHEELPGGGEVWDSLSPADIEDEWVEIEHQWRPETLRTLFEEHGFRVCRQDAIQSGGMVLAFSVLAPDA